MKTPDEIFNWLVRNSEYYNRKISDEEIKDYLKKSASDNEAEQADALISLLVYCNYVVPFHVKLEEYMNFVAPNEEYSYASHLKPLVDAGLINVINPNSSDKCTGIVCDYSTSTSLVRYWIGNSHP